MFQQYRGIEIKGISSCVPKNIIGNDRFDNMFSGKERRIFEKTVGILERRWVDSNTASSDLGFAAASDLLSQSQCVKSEIDTLLFVSQTADYKLPFCSNMLQSRLGLNGNVFCLDINAGCAGFIQGLHTAFALANAHLGRKVLLIISETLSKILSPYDRGTSPLFGDGASALLIENTGALEVVFSFNLFTDGSSADAIGVPHGGSKVPISEESFIYQEDEKGNRKNGTHLSMDGGRVFDFTQREVITSVEDLLEKVCMPSSSVDAYLFHQSNQFIIKQFGAKLNIAPERLLLNIQRYGNTSGVSIPLLLAEQEEKIRASDTLLFSGYGVGLNWGNCLAQNNKFHFINFFEC